MRQSSPTIYEQKMEQEAATRIHLVAEPVPGAPDVACRRQAYSESGACSGNRAAQGGRRKRDSYYSVFCEVSALRGHNPAKRCNDQPTRQAAKTERCRLPPLPLGNDKQAKTQKNPGQQVAMPYAEECGERQFRRQPETQCNHDDTQEGPQFTNESSPLPFCDEIQHFTAGEHAPHVGTETETIPEKRKCS